VPKVSAARPTPRTPKLGQHFLIDTSAAGNEPGLGGFQITLDDSAGGTGDPTGTPTYDMFNMPLSNALAGTLDPTTGKDACPISTQVTALSESGDSTQNGIVGMIVTCPYYESDGTTVSPLAGQAIVKNLYAGRYGVVANPGADRIGHLDHQTSILGLDQMLVGGAAVAEVVAEFDAAGDALADFRQDGEGLGAGVDRAGLVIALPGQHLLTDIPLQREAIVGDHGGDSCDLAEQMAGQRG